MSEQKFCIQGPLIKTVAEFPINLRSYLARQGWGIHVRDSDLCCFDADAVTWSCKEGSKLLIFAGFRQFFHFQVFFPLLVGQPDLLFNFNFFLNLLLQPNLLAIPFLQLFLLLPVPPLLLLYLKILFPFKSFCFLLSFTVSPLLFFDPFFFLFVSL